MDSISAITSLIFLEHKPQKADLLIIPGTGKRELSVRASDIFHKGLVEKIITTGGKQKEGISEALLQKSLLIKQGVPSSTILTEEYSTNTKEIAVFSEKLILKEKIKHNKIMLVCKSYHARRVYMTFKKQFSHSKLIIVPVECDGINKNNWYKEKLKREYVLKELKKIGEYTSKGDLGI